MEASLEEKEWAVSLKFHTGSEDFGSGYGHDSNGDFISILHYNQQDRLELKFPYTRRKFQCFNFTTDGPYCGKNL